MNKQKLKPLSREELKVVQCKMLLNERRALLRSCRVCKIAPTPILSSRERARCKRINDAFDEVRIFCGKSEVRVFKDVYPDNDRQALDALGKFTRDVRSCPQEVLDYIAKLLEEARVGRQKKGAGG